MKVIIYRDPKEGYLSYLRSSDNKSFPLQLNGDVFKIHENFSEIENATDYEVKLIVTQDGIPTYQIFRRPSIFGGGSGKKGADGPQGPAGATGATGATGPSQVFANALFVDAIYGDDANAVPFSFMDNTTNPASHKYQTLDAARDAASAGDLIIVYPGNYTALDNLYKNGVSYYFYPGTNVTCDLTRPNGLFVTINAGEECNVYGKANLENTHVSAGGSAFVIASLVQATLNVECNNISSHGNAIYIQDGFVKVLFNDVNVTNDNGTVSMQDSASVGNTFTLIGNTMRSTHSVAGTNSVINAVNSTGFIGTAYIKCNQIIGSATNTANLIAIANGASGVGANVADITIEANELIPLNLAGNPLMDIFNNTNTKVTLKSNADLGSVVSSRSIIVITGTNTGGENVIFGRYVSNTGRVLNVAGLDDTTRFNGVAISSAGETVITSTQCTFYVDGEIRNLSEAGIGLSKSGLTSPTNDVIVGDLKIITDNGLPVSAAVGDTVRVIHSLAMNNVSSPVAALLNSIVGSICYTDAGVI